jgi:polysaccharide pyruvyl transferase CsaB
MHGTYRVTLYSPDRSVVYDGRTPDETGVGGGITARLSLVEALASLGHDVTACLNAAAPLEHRGVRYVPLDDVRAIDCDVLIAISTGGDRSFAPLRDLPVDARLRVVWVQGVPEPDALDAVAADYVCAASNFLRAVCVERWGVPASRLVVFYNGLRDDLFRSAEEAPLERDPFALVYVGPPDKGLAAAMAVLRRLRAADVRYRLDVYGGAALWGAAEPAWADEPGVRFQGLLGQRDLIPRLFAYEYCLAPQSIEEGFGIALQEAKRAGAIVLASAVGAFTELVRDGQDGFLIDGPHDAAATHERAAGLILELAGDPARRHRVRQHALATPWSWNTAARAWTAHWDHVLGRAHAPRADVPGRGDVIDLPDGLHDTSSGEFCPADYPCSPMLEAFGRTARVLIGGYYGHGNLGDEAILQAMLEELRGLEPNLSATVVSGDPESTHRTHHVETVHDRDVPALLAAAEGSDLIVLGGGGLFHDYHGVDEATPLTRLHWGLTFVDAFPMMASMFDRPLLLYGVGVGPLGTEAGRRHTRLAFERADAATVRDPESLELLRAIGAPTARVAVTADPAFRIAAPPVEGSDLAALGLPPDRSRPLVAVAVRAWRMGDGAPDWPPAVAAALDRFVRARDVTLLFVPCQTPQPDELTDDRGAAEHVAGLMRERDRAIVGPGPFSPVRTQAIFGACELVVAMRLHAAILAAGAGVPIAAMAYDPKVRSVMRQLGLEDSCVDLAAATADAVFDRVDAAWTGRAATASALPARVARLRAASTRNGEAAATLLRQRPYAPRRATPAMTAVLYETLRRQAVRADVHERRAEAQQDGRVAELDEALRRANEALAEATASREEARRQLETIASSRAWRAITRYRRVRQALGRGGPVRAAGWVARGAARAVLPPPVRTRLRRAVAARLQTPSAYVFDRYRRARAGLFGATLAGVRAPGTAGLVSVILPARNGGAMIAGAIGSVLAQTYSRFELVIVDDGSTDGTARIADDYARRDARVHVIHQDHRRLPAALSRGFRQARGEYLTWTSCDNRLKPTCLERLVDCLERHPDWDMAYANLDLIGEDGAPLRGSEFYEGYQRPHRSEHVALPRETGELNVWANNYVGAAFLYRSRVAALIGDYSRHRFVSEDYDYWMRVNALMVLRHADFDEPVYDYRFHDGSLTSRWAELRMLEHRERLMVFDDFRRDFNLLPLVWVIRGTGQVADALARHARAAGHLVQAGEGRLDALPRLWVPVVRVTVADDPAAATPPPPVRAHTTDVLVTTAATLPGEAPDGWHLCCAAGTPSELRCLEPRYRGWIAAADTRDLCHAIDVHVRSRHLAAIETEIEETPPPDLAASVVVCSHRAGEGVARAIASVLAQSMSPDRYEVIVVDNALDAGALAADVERLRRSHRAHHPDRLRLVACPIRGLSAARNAGLAEARGEVVCFVDDDAVAAPDWLERICAAFASHPEAGVIGGHIHLKVPDPRPFALRPGWEKYWSHFVTGHQTCTEVRHWWEFPWGANWCARRKALLQACGFRTQYGRVGDNFWGGEELVAAAIVRRLGWTIAIAPDARVEHDVDPRRFTFEHVLRTLVAGQQVGYLAQRDLYIPAESSLTRTMRELVMRHRDPELPAGRGRWRNIGYRKLAQLRLLAAQLRDLRRRLRRPVVAPERSGKA